MDETKEINHQVGRIPYDTTKEIPRSAFEIKGLLGSGNFGSVHLGVINLNEEKGSKTKVAIKSLQGLLGRHQLQNFMYEIKIMGYVNRHLNLVNMVGSCTSELEKSKDIWLLIEFCDLGDLKDYLAKHKKKILSGKQQDPINNRVLVQWAYQVSKGMDHLASIFIMHGDLAARNILLQSDALNNSCPVAKVADFGLSKHLYYDTTYQKENRLEIPWKWTALEYLESDYLCLKSDVWSFMVLVWEIFSFGKSPYGQSSYHDALDKLQTGWRLPCPKGLEKIITWSPEKLYSKLSSVCFAAELNDRGSFKDVIDVLEGELTNEELNQYVHQCKAYD